MTEVYLLFYEILPDIEGFSVCESDLRSVGLFSFCLFGRIKSEKQL